MFVIHDYGRRRFLKNTPFWVVMLGSFEKALLFRGTKHP
jgi:hypothetical protein